MLTKTLKMDKSRVKAMVVNNTCSEVLIKKIWDLVTVVEYFQDK